MLDALYKAEVDFFKFVADARVVTNVQWNEAIGHLEEVKKLYWPTDKEVVRWEIIMNKGKRAQTEI